MKLLNEIIFFKKSIEILHVYVTTKWKPNYWIIIILNETTKDWTKI